MKTSSLHVGYDIGGTKIELVLIDSHLNILFRERLPTERDRGYEHILSVLKKLWTNCLKDQNISSNQISSIGLGMPGTVDPNTQIMLIGNTQVLIGKNIKEDLLEALGVNIPVFVENDANCFALAECLHGAGQNMVGVILGTGVGGGIILNGKIHSGRRGSAGEIGHLFLKDGGKKCYCGQYDCAELYLSGTGFKNNYIEQTNQTLSTMEIFKIPEYRDAYKKDLAMFLAKLTNILDPDYFVLGGGVSRVDELYTDMDKLMAPFLFYKKSPPPVLKHKISDSAGSIGAALLAKQFE